MKNYGHQANLGGIRKLRFSLPMILILAAIGVGVLSFIIQSVRETGNLSTGAIVTRVNGEPVTYREFKLHFDSNKPLVVYDFQQKYGAGVKENSNFWSTAYEGQTPIEVLRKKALQECVAIKVQQLLMRQKGILTDISYQKFLRDLTAENKKHQTQYSEAQYFNNVFSNKLTQLKEIMAGAEIPVDTNILQKYYETCKANYRMGEELTIQMIVLRYGDSYGGAAAAKKQAMQALAADIKRRLDKGESFESLAKAYNQDHSVMQMVFNPAKGRSQYMFYGDLIAAAGALHPGQISQVIEREGEFNIIKMIRRKDLGYIPFSQCENLVRQNYVNSKYEEHVQKLIKEADVVINHTEYDKINVE